ncbi:IS1634 family transposase [Arabiibacter massiliensis]|uniref:IS1634 family transposase n=1 Tax=Arabiibacter massiliensis TaxID=1870985 RepID=UPI00155AD24B|nr:IS1634 family transposase [Arabiibacter massiliensis]
MYLKKTKTREGRIYLSITEGFRKDGKVRTRTVESCGYLDELEEAYEDPIAHFEARARALTEEKRRSEAPVLIEARMSERIDKRASATRLNIGSLVLSRYYHALGIGAFWDSRKVHAHLGFDANAAFRMLTYMRILSPESKKASFEKRGMLPDRCEFSLDDVYHALSFFARYEDRFKAHLDSAVESLRERDRSRTYYDVTNYYFEIEDEDDLRRRGVSKEHRPNPIVQMGLLLDADGIPLDYEVFSGNVNDSLTLLPVMKKMRSRHPHERTVVVADKGLNTSNNIAAAVLDGNGFAFSQSVRKATRSLKAWVLEDGGYAENEAGTFKVKSRQSYKEVVVEGEDGATRKERIPVKQVAFWSKDFFERARRERAKVIEKSKAAIERGGMASAKARSSVRYAKDTPCVPSTGEVAEHLWSLDEEKIAADEAMDGYYCIVTSETYMDERDVIELYRGLWRIEETFRVTKSTLDARPVYVSREDRIRAHFMICYAALVIMRLIQADLGWKHSAQAIADDLAAMTGVNEDANVYLFGHRTDLSDELGRVAGLDLARRRYTRKQIKDMLASTKKM